MPKVYQIQGYGEFYDNNGNLQKYPINKLVLSNGEDTLEFKLDKVQKRILPYMFDLVKTDIKTEDDNGVECDLYELKDRGSVEVDVK